MAGKLECTAPAAAVCMLEWAALAAALAAACDVPSGCWTVGCGVIIAYAPPGSCCCIPAAKPAAAFWLVVAAGILIPGMLWRGGGGALSWGVAAAWFPAAVICAPAPVLKWGSAAA